MLTAFVSACLYRRRLRGIAAGSFRRPHAGAALRHGTRAGFPSCPSCPSWFSFREAAVAVTALDRRKRLRRTPGRQRSPPFPQIRVQSAFRFDRRLPGRRSPSASRSDGIVRTGGTPMLPTCPPPLPSRRSTAGNVCAGRRGGSDRRLFPKSEWGQAASSELRVAS
jgi:hypothetical protein